MDSSESPTKSPTAAPTSRANIVYLDQNKWIDLARAAKAPVDHPRTRPLLEMLCTKLEAGQIRLPLTASNLYETHKLADAEQRFTLAYTQATLSRAEVFRGRRRRLEVEVGRVLSRIYERPWTEPNPDWVFSRVFFEAHIERGDPNFRVPVSEQMLAVIRANPQAALLDHLAGIDDDVRREAVARFEAASEALRADIEARRARDRDESLSMRRKIYGVLLAWGEQQTLFTVADQVGLPWRCFEDNNGATLRAVIRDTPSFFVEREIVLKLEAQARAIHVNDLRDMRNFATVLPYADIVVAETQFTNLARQAGLGERLGVRLETDLEVLSELV